MSELEKIEHDKQVYTKWLCEDKSKPIRAIHWLWEYLETPHQEDNKLTEDDELDILQSFINYKRGSKPQLTIPKSIADELEEEIEEAYSNDYIRSYSDVGAYMEVITDGLDEDSELYKFMFPDNDALLGCSHRNIIYLYLVDNDLVKVVEV